MFRRFTEGRLALSGTHGFQAWRADTLQVALPLAEELWGTSSEHCPSVWGFDAAVVLAADAIGRPPKVVAYPAQELRDRDPRKIDAQEKAVLNVLRSYRNRLGRTYRP